MAAAHLHPTDHQTQDQVAQQLLGCLQADSHAGTRAACAEALGLLAAGVASPGKLLSPYGVCAIHTDEMG